MISARVQTLLNDIANRYGKQLLQQVERAMSRYRRSGHLMESLELTIIRATDRESPRIVIIYADQGYFIGQRSPQWSQLPDMKNLQEWAKHIDLKGPVSGYKNGVAPNLPPWKIQQRALWAIAFAKKKFDSHKPKRWKRDAKLPDLLSNLNEQTLKAFSAEIERVLTAELQGRPTS
jgi:hypothetical protein